MKGLSEEANTDNRAAITYSDTEGYQFFISNNLDGNPNPGINIKVMGLCYLRMTTDPKFNDEMLDWARKSAN